LAGIWRSLRKSDAWFADGSTYDDVSVGSQSGIKKAEGVVASEVRLYDAAITES
jgi:hypothetical protein